MVFLGNVGNSNTIWICNQHLLAHTTYQVRGLKSRGLGFDRTNCSSVCPLFDASFSMDNIDPARGVPPQDMSKGCQSPQYAKAWLTCEWNNMFLKDLHATNLLWPYEECVDTFGVGTKCLWPNRWTLDVSIETLHRPSKGWVCNKAWPDAYGYVTEETLSFCIQYYSLYSHSNCCVWETIEVMIVEGCTLEHQGNWRELSPKEVSTTTMSRILWRYLWEELQDLGNWEWVLILNVL